jgi:hypothetical protein
MLPAPGDEGAGVIAGPVALAGVGSLARFRPERLRYLRCIP